MAIRIGSPFPSAESRHDAGNGSSTGSAELGPQERPRTSTGEPTPRKQPNCSSTQSRAPTGREHPCGVAASPRESRRASSAPSVFDKNGDIYTEPDHDSSGEGWR